MSAANQAVFLSYASQDAEAARRICESLRSGGVEVWFDADGGLEHGDEWDAKIRRQIKECVLFIPVISANTQARHEGYFRIEWDLAAERARGIASGVPFILPVVIDDTREPDALVPDRFRMVQWTRLHGGEVPSEVQQRFLKLWSHRTGVLKHEAREVAQASSLHPAQTAGWKPALPRTVGRRVPVAAWGIATFAAVFAVVGYFWLKHSNATTAPALSSAKGPPAAEKNAAPVSEARKLLTHARALFENRNLTRDDLTLAEDYCRQALKLDPNDAEVWAVYSELDSAFIGTAIDASPERTELSRMQAERALKLNPRSTEARLAKAVYLRRTGAPGEPEAEKILRELATEIPGDPRVLINLGKLLWGATGVAVNLQRADEALGLFARAAAIPSGRAEALSERAWLLTNLGRYDEAEEAIDESLRLQPNTGTIAMKITLEFVQGKTDAGLAAVGRLSDEALHNDFGASLAIMTWLSAGQPDKVLKLLNSIPRDYFSSNGIPGAADSWRGLAYQMLGRDEAARAAWQSALQVVERRLRDAPRAPGPLIERAQLLAELGQREAATAALKLYDQMYPDTDAFVLIRVNALGVHALLDPPDGVIDRLEAMLKGTKAGFLRIDFRFAPLRERPRFKALVERLAPAAHPAGKNEAVSAPDQKSAPADKSVAVLAFENLSDDKANEYFSDGISEELLTVLQNIPGLHVAARTSAFFFKGKNATAQEIGEKLGVAHLVEGSVQKIGNRVKISARLSRAATGEQLWSANYTRDLADLFAVQSEIAQTIVAQLRGQLTGEAAAAAKSEIQAQVQAAEIGGTRNVEAHELYLQGKFFVNQHTAESAIRAAGLLRRAVELDPQFALAWAALSGAGLVRGGLGETKQDFEGGFKLAREAADRALALAPDLAAAHVARANLLLEHDFDWKGAAESLQRARALVPSDPEVLAQTARLAFSLGQAERAVELGRQAVALDPANPHLRMMLGFALSSVGRDDEAKAEFQRIIELSPSSPWGHAGASMILTAQGKADEAVAEAAKDKFGFLQLYGLAIAEWARGNNRAADAALAELIKSASDVAAAQIAWIYAFRHDNDRAFEWLERAYRQRDGGLAYTKANFALESLHTDPRWPAFWKRIGLTDEQLK